MTRTIDSATLAQSEASQMRPVFFVKLAFDSGNVCFQSLTGPITWGGDTYTGAGQLGSIGSITEDSVLGRSPITLSLSGLPTALLAQLFSEQYQGRIATVYQGYLDSTFQLVANPIIIFRGLMDSPVFQQDSQLAIALNVETRFARWDNPLVRRYNDADQRALFPGDKGMEFVAQATNQEIYWGVAAPT